MSFIRRDRYVKQLLAARTNGRVKIITGIRRCGKSYLLFKLFKEQLLSEGVDEAHIVEVALDRKEFSRLRNPNELYEHVMARVVDDRIHYVFVDEIQLSYRVKRADVDESLVPPEDRDLLYVTFYDVLNDLMARPNLDVYVTGSNSKMLSSDIVTNFRDRGTEVRVEPLSFAEFHAWSKGEKAEDWDRYLVYGGMPAAVLEPDDRARERYLQGLFQKVYKADIVERYGIDNEYVLDALMDALSSAVGSLTNPSKLTKTLNSVAHAKTTDKTVKRYLDALVDSFLFRKAARYDVKGKRYFDYPMKYYAVDAGLRNARLNFRQVEETHLMENILYNELVMRGYSVDVGAVRFADAEEGSKAASMHEIDFVLNMGAQKLYIQSALSIEGEGKRAQETSPLLKTGDFFRKIVVTGGSRRPSYDENGIMYVGVIPFLLDESLI
ncbi:MAG TPA: ATP-binding protein [Candidatus Aphodovivens avistercoris]|nr:ATP-binding protein [Candidatus Aphodovivens avistercoris]